MFEEKLKLRRKSLQNITIFFNGRLLFFCLLVLLLQY